MKASVKDTTITAGGLMIQQVLAFVVGVFIARQIGSEDYGTLGIARNYTAILLTLLPLGLDLGLLKYLPTVEGRRPFAESQFIGFRAVVYVVNILIVLIAFLVAPILEAHVYRFHNFAIYFSITAASLPFLSDLALFGAYFRAFGRPADMALLTMYFQSLVRSGLSFVAIWLGYSTMGVVIVSTSVAAVTVLMAHLHRSRNVLPKAIGDTASRDPIAWLDIGGQLKESVWMSLNLFVFGLLRSADVVVLGYFVAAPVVGSYSAISLISYIVSVFPMALSQTIGPNTARYHRENRPDLIKTLLDNYIRMASILAAFTFAGIAAYGNRLDLLLGPSYKFSMELAFLMPLGYFVSATLAPAGFALSMTGKHRLELMILSLSGALLLGLLVLFIPLWGGLGAAAAVAVTFSVGNVIRFMFVARHIGVIPGRLFDFTPPVIALAAAYFSKYISETYIGMTFIDVVLGCLIYAFIYGLIGYTAFLTSSERVMIGNRIRKLLKLKTA